MSSAPLSTDSGRHLGSILRIVLNVGVVLVFGAAAYVASDWQMRTAVMPLTVAGLGIALGILNVVVDARRLRTVGAGFVNVDRGQAEVVTEVGADELAARESEEIKQGLRYFAWLVGYLLLMRVVGAAIASGVLLLLFFRLEGKQSWRFTLLGAAGAIVAIFLLDEVLNLRLPRNMLGL